MINIKHIKNNYCSEDVLHIFVVTNPIQCLIINEYVYTLNIKTSNLVLIEDRNLNILSYPKFIINNKNTNLLNRFLRKLFNYEKTILDIKKILKSQNKKFILYLPWDLNYFYALINHELCIGHVYIEEGDLSYLNKHVMHDWRRLSSHEIKEKLRLPVKYGLFNHNCKFVIVTDYKCFPKLTKTKKLKIDSFNFIPKIYQTKLKNGDCVGVLPAALRLNVSNLSEVLKYFKQYLSHGDYLKTHPSLRQKSKLKKKLFEINKNMNNYFNIIENEVILEAEIITHSIKFYGLKSSVKRYVDRFNGEYIEIKELLHLQQER